MKRVIALIALVGASAGCNELVGIDRFRVDRDGGEVSDGGGDRPDGSVMDGGDPDDGGPDDGGDTGDACTPRTFYRDVDEDSFGDPDVTVEECVAPDGYVEDAGDCDDGDGAIHPGVEETCDGVDQDCDEALDEGLMEPLGAPIELSRIDCCLSHHPSVAAWEGGFVVSYRDPFEYRMHYRRIPKDGGVGSDSLGPASAGGVGQQKPRVWIHEDPLVAATAVIAWEETNGLRAMLLSAEAGAPLSPFFLTPDDTSNTQMTSVGSRVLVTWQSLASGELEGRLINPLVGTADGDVVSLGFGSPSDSYQGVSGLSAVSGSSAMATIFRLAETPEDSGVHFGILSTSPLEWASPPTPAASGPFDPVMLTLPLPQLEPRTVVPVAATDGFSIDANACFGRVDSSLPSGPDFVGSCEPFAAAPVAMAHRGGVASTLVIRGTDRLAVLEYPLSPSAGSSPIFDVATVGSAEEAEGQIAGFGNALLVLYEDRETVGAGPDEEVVLYAQRVSCVP